MPVLANSTNYKDSTQKFSQFLKEKSHPKNLNFPNYTMSSKQNKKKPERPLTMTVPGADSDGFTELWYATLLCTELWS